jgi:predicted metalloprotease
MKWQDMRQSGNVQDVRGRRVSGPVAAGGMGIGGLIVLLIASALLGVNPGDIINGSQGIPSDPSSSTYEQQLPAGTPAQDREAQFVRAVLGDTEDVWSTIFKQQMGREYPATTLVLFSDGAESACGSAQTMMGPFYCPNDQSVYLDMNFFHEIEAAAGANADFARAYAIAHEVGHHVQDVMGTLSHVHSLQQQSSESESNALQVRIELQADCYAGVWGHFTAQRGLINNEDVETALNTAAQIGDDYLQRQARGYVVPESFTHGSSAQRVEWFRRGLQTGDVAQCDTFK